MIDATYDGKFYDRGDLKSDYFGSTAVKNWYNTLDIGNFEKLYKIKWYDVWCPRNYELSNV